MSVRCIPSSPRWLDSVYVGNLIRGLQQQGVSFDLPADESGDFLSARWLRTNAGNVDLLHFHWTHYHYTAETWLRSVSKLCKFIGKILLARRLGYRIVWTMHNYMPHERKYPLLHYTERLLLAQLAHAVIVHCGHGRFLLQKKFLRRRNVFVIAHGDFGPYMNSRPRRSVAREELRFADDDTILYFFGSIRPYKQVPLLIREFAEVDGANLRLVVTGATPDDALKAEIMELAEHDSRVYYQLEYISDADLAIYLGAADIAVLPFRDILGSGSAITALSSSLPVVAPKVGCLTELITRECGELYDPGVGAIAGAIRRIVHRDLQAMSEAARKRAQQFPWETMVQETAKVYRTVLDRSGSLSEMPNQP